MTVYQTPKSLDLLQDAPNPQDAPLMRRCLPITAPNTQLPRPTYAASESINPLIAAADPLLNLIPKLRQSTSYEDIDSLKSHLIDEIKCFEIQAGQAHFPQETILIARYALCCVLDETISATPWGKLANWPGQCLLLHFQGERFNQSKLFRMIHHLKQKPDSHLELLELIYLILSLGYQGEYKHLHHGQAILDKLTEDLFARIRAKRGDVDAQLAMLSECIEQPDHPRPLLPLWTVFLLTATLLFTLYTGFNYVLNTNTAPLYETLASIQTEPLLP